MPAQEAHAMVGSEVLKHANSQADMELNNLNEFAIVSNGISEERKIIKDDSHSTSRLHSNHRHGSPGNISWSTKLNPFKRRVIPILPDNRGVSGEYRAGFFSALYFQWMVPLMSVGYQRPLELKDIWNVNPDRGVEGVSKKFKLLLEKRRTTSSHPLTLALYDTFRSDFLVGGICQLIAGCIQVLLPFVLKYLIYFIQDAYNAQYNGGIAPHIAKGIGYVVGIACLQIVQSLCMNHYYYRAMILGGQVRSVLVACLFEKALKLSARMKTGGEKDNEEGWSNGRINNLMSTDTSRMESASVTFHRCWVAPIQLILALALLCINLTYSALVGFGLICAVTPLFGLAVKSLMVRRRVINKLTDHRIQLTQETFNAIRTVKLFAWESKLLSRLAAIREIEIQKIAYLLGIRNAILAIAVVMPILASMLTFITYSLSSHMLDAAPIFSSLALFNALGIPLEILPVAVGRVVDGLPSTRRIYQFLSAEEWQDDAILDLQGFPAFTIDNASFVWDEPASHVKTVAHNLDPNLEIKSAKVIGNSDPGLGIASDSVESAESFRKPFKIRNVSLAIGRKEFVAVIGGVASGKSSLISALASEMRKTGGSVTLGSSRALCSQSPWIQSTTLRGNIIFGKEYESSLYKRVIDACSLRPDIDMLPSGDMTEIGEKGVTISGGQKQRLNIARAIYFNADIVLMDDPLSAVDTHVGQHILDHAICGLLRDKCRILVTHQLHVLHRADRIIWMKDGCIHKIATFPDLMSGDLEFQKIMETNHKQVEKTQLNEVKVKVENKTTSPAILSTPHDLMQEEERARGSVGLSTYMAFVKASGTIFSCFIVLFVLVLAQGSNILTSLWLSWWTSNQFANLTTAHYIGIYATLGIVQALLMFSYATTLTTFSTRAAKNLLNSAIFHTLGAPVLFFDTTPMGRVTNRFSKDVDTIDNRLTDNLRFLLYIVATVVSVFCLVIAYFYYFVIALIPLTVAFIFAASYYQASAREIKRHEAVLRSVVFAKFGEAIIGTTTIRAYGVQSQFITTVVQALDSMNGAYFLTFAGQRWLSTRLDTLGSMLIFVVGILIVTSRFDVKPAISGLVLSYILSIVQLIQIIVHTYADVENDMNSVERLHYYSHGLEQEESVDTIPQKVRATWPERGELHFKDVQMRYRPGLPLVLKGFSVSIRSGARVGIVGRTGAGKTSLISAIFRLVNLSSGSITIDGMNIAAVSLYELRSRLSIIPQDPILFQGTIRTNLDPLEEYDDSRLWDALQQAELVEGKLPTGKEQSNTRISLDSPVEDEGVNYSLGQRQLLALARILVKDSQIIMIDEATSSVDFETDKRVQDTILQAFRTKTLLCVAHRIKTIIGYVKSDAVLLIFAY